MTSRGLQHGSIVPYQRLQASFFFRRIALVSSRLSFSFGGSSGAKGGRSLAVSHGKGKVSAPSNPCRVQGNIPRGKLSNPVVSGCSRAVPVSRNRGPVPTLAAKSTIGKSFPPGAVTGPLNKGPAPTLGVKSSQGDS